MTGNIARRLPVFEQEACCHAFIEVCSKLKKEWPFKLVAYILMPDHIHLIVNPKDGRIRELAGTLKSLAARRIIDEAKGFSFLKEKPDPDGGGRTTFRSWGKLLLNGQRKWHGNKVRNRGAGAAGASPPSGPGIFFDVRPAASEGKPTFRTWNLLRSRRSGATSPNL